MKPPNTDLNTLVTSLSHKVPLIKALRNAYASTGLTGRIWGTDINAECIGRYFIDDFWQMPALNEMNIELFHSFCKDNNIQAVIPTRDGELLFFAKHKDLLEAQGVQLMLSHQEPIENCLDKVRFFNTLKMFNYPVIPTETFPEKIQDDTLVVKERYGSGSKCIALNVSLEEAKNHAETLREPIFQPYIKGKEYSVDLYLTRSGKTHGVVARWRVCVKDGESQITVTQKLPDLEQLCSRIAESLNLFGHVLFQVIQDDTDGLFHIVECNPRFGGASTLSVAAGLDSLAWFLHESIGNDLQSVPFVRYPSELRLVRHPEDWIYHDPGI